MKSDQGSPETLETVSLRAAEPEPRERLILGFQDGEAAMNLRFFMTIFYCHGGEAEIIFMVLICWDFFYVFTSLEVKLESELMNSLCLLQNLEKKITIFV